MRERSGRIKIGVGGIKTCGACARGINMDGRVPVRSVPMGCGQQDQMHSSGVSQDQLKRGGVHKIKVDR